MLATRLAGAGAPPSVVIGVRRALERGRGRNAVPVATALAGTVLAVTALCGTVVFGSSLTHLTATPRLYGQAFDVWFNGLNRTVRRDPVLTKLKADPAVTAITLGTSGSVFINGVATDAIAGQPLRGKLLVSSVNGGFPAAPGEVALGVATCTGPEPMWARSSGRRARSRAGACRPRTFHVVGTASFPPDFGVVGLDNGAIFSVAGLVDAQCRCRARRQSVPHRRGPELTYVLLAGVKGGAAGRAAVAHYVADVPGDRHRAGDADQPRQLR